MFEVGWKHINAGKIEFCVIKVPKLHFKGRNFCMLEKNSKRMELAFANQSEWKICKKKFHTVESFHY